MQCVISASGRIPSSARPRMAKPCDTAEPTPMSDHGFKGREGYPTSLRACLSTPFSSPEMLKSTTFEGVRKNPLLGDQPRESRGPCQPLGIGPVVLSAIPDEVFAGRLAEAGAEYHGGAERLCSAPADRNRRWQRRSAGAQENRDGIADSTAGGRLSAASQEIRRRT